MTPRTTRRLGGLVVAFGLLLAPSAGASATAAPSVPAPAVPWGADQARPEPAADPAPSSATAAAPASAVRLAAATAGASSWVVRGAGWGHSLGMSQYGAMEMAKDGWSAAQILGHYYSGTTYDAVADTQVVQVNILHAVASTTATSAALSTGGGAFSVTAGGRTMSGVAGQTVTFSRSGASVVASCAACSGATSVSGPSATLTWDTAAAKDRTAMSIGGTRYRDGHTVLTPSTSGSTLEVVNHVRLHDEYLDYLRESPWSWPLESLKAQAAAARGYALRKVQAGVRSVCACHVYDTTADQVYGGYPSSGDLPYWAGWQKAVRATGSTTTGYVVRSRGAVIQAYYSSSSGGRTENNEDVWGGTPLSYLRGVSDPWSLRSSNPRASWKQTVAGSSLASAFGLADVVRLDLTDRTVNGGIHTATATSSTGARGTITGEQFRGRLATNSIAVRHLTSRLGGATRYATAAAVAASVRPTATDVVLAAGDSTLADAAVAGPLAHVLGAPVLLTAQGGIPQPTAAELDRRGSTVRTVWVIGGTGVVSDVVVEQLRSRGLTVNRIAGTNRYETSQLVAAEIARRSTVRTVALAGGGGIPDALGASGASSALGEPILLTAAGELSAATREALTSLRPSEVRILGGTGVVGAAAEADARSLAPTVRRLAGGNRWATSAAVADFYRPLVPVTSEIVLASGYDDNLVDALVAGARERLIALTPPGGLTAEAARTLQSTPLLETVTAVGGTGAITDHTLTAAARS